MEQEKKEKIFKEEIVDLVIARLETLPENAVLSIGDKGSFTIKDLIGHIKDGDDIGKAMVEMQMAYILSFKESILDKENESSSNETEA